MWPRNVIVDKPSQSDLQRISCYRDFDLLDSEQDRHVSPSVYPEYDQNQLESAASASSVYFRRKYFQNKLAWTHLKKNFYYKKNSENIPKEKKHFGCIQARFLWTHVWTSPGLLRCTIADWKELGQKHRRDEAYVALSRGEVRHALQIMRFSMSSWRAGSSRAIN